MEKHSNVLRVNFSSSKPHVLINVVDYYKKTNLIIVMECKVIIQMHNKNNNISSIQLSSFLDPIFMSYSLL